MSGAEHIVPTAAIYALLVMMWPNMRPTPFSNREVAAKFKAYPPRVRRKIMALHELVFRLLGRHLGWEQRHA